MVPYFFCLRCFEPGQPDLGGTRLSTRRGDRLGDLMRQGRCHAGRQGEPVGSDRLCLPFGQAGTQLAGGAGGGVALTDDRATQQAGGAKDGDEGLESGEGPGVVTEQVQQQDGQYLADHQADTGPVQAEPQGRSDDGQKKDEQIVDGGRIFLAEHHPEQPADRQAGESKAGGNEPGTGRAVAKQTARHPAQCGRCNDRDADQVADEQGQGGSDEIGPGDMAHHDQQQRQGRGIGHGRETSADQQAGDIGQPVKPKVDFEKTACDMGEQGIGRGGDRGHGRNHVQVEDAVHDDNLCQYDAEKQDCCSQRRSVHHDREQQAQPRVPGRDRKPFVFVHFTQPFARQIRQDQQGDDCEFPRGRATWPVGATFTTVG